MQTIFGITTLLQGEMLVYYSENLSEESIGKILKFSKQIAGSDQMTAAYAFGDYSSKTSVMKTAPQLLLVIRGFQPKLINYVKTFDKRSVVVLAVDQWVFERDVDRGFLGEAVAFSLIFPYMPVINEKYLILQEVKLKKRLIIELLENLVQDFPELSYEFCIRPEYFMYETMINRARLFPPMIHDVLGYMHENSKKGDTKCTINGYLEALRELEKEGMINFADGYVKMSEKFVIKARSPRAHFENLSKTVPRALFTSMLGVFSKILIVLTQNKAFFRPKSISEDTAIAQKIEIPKRYVYIPTVSGLVPLANKTDILTSARKVLSANKDTKIEVEPIGGILNDVYLIKAYVDEEEKRIVAKRFKDWSNIKWFPLTLWTVGTRTFAVFGRSRLERECAINQLLHSKGFAVPKLLYVSTEERLVFMEYVKGENLRQILKKLVDPEISAKEKKELKTIERVGKKFAKVHSLGIALGDTKPENILIREHGEICFMDFEQAFRKGDIVWDIAEFLYYAGHDLPPLSGIHTAEAMADAFIKGYLEAGGKAKNVKKAANPKYTKVFSVFTLPHILFAISNKCRNADKLE